MIVVDIAYFRVIATRRRCPVNTLFDEFPAIIVELFCFRKRSPPYCKKMSMILALFGNVFLNASGSFTNSAMLSAKSSE